MSSSIYYFLIANQTTQQEVGSYIDNSANNNINDFNIISEKAKEILRTNKNKNQKNKVTLENEFNIYYIVTNSNTFYLAAVGKNSKYSSQENLIFELIEDIDHQGIKKLVDKNGELTNVGRQNLKFSIEKYQESNGISKSSIYDTESTKIDETNNQSKIKSVSKAINDITSTMKSNVENMLSNVNEMNDLDSKSSRIRDASIQFQKDSLDLSRKAKWARYKAKILIIVVLLVITILILYLIFK